MKIMCRVELTDSGLVLVFPSMSVKDEMTRLYKAVEGKFNGYIVAELKKPYNSRTNQQNKMFWAIVQQIAEDTGADLDDIELEIKKRALKRGYPYDVNKLTNEPKPVSMSTVNTVEMGYLIDEAEQLATELGIVIEFRVSGDYAILG